MLHQLVGWEKVAGSIQDGSIGDIGGSVIVSKSLAAELSRIDGRGAKGTVAAFPYSLLYFPLDGRL